MQPRNITGITINEKISGTVCGANTVPSNKPSDAEARHASVRMIASSSQLSTCNEVTSRATSHTHGNTMSAASSACSAPNTIFWIATRLVGSGAIARSSISLLTLNSFTSGSATEDTPWNMIAKAMRPGSRIVP